MTADLLLSRLEKVRRTGPDRWIARCPGHADKTPSLSIRELDDGRSLLHCFAGCGIGEVLGAVGLDFDALFPARAIDHHLRRERRPFNAHDILACLETEALIVSIVAADIVTGREVSAADKDRVLTAAGRISAAREVARGN